MAHQHNSIRTFVEGRDIVEEIVRGGMSKYVSNLPNIVTATELRDRHIRCIDGRTHGGLHLAGSGILLEIDPDLSVAAAVEFGRKAKATAVTYHQDCGAVEICLKAHHIKIGSKNRLTLYAREFAQTVASELEVPCLEALLEGPVGFHPERAVYYTKVDFDPSGEKRLPMGFVVSRGYLRLGYALQELSVALQIAFGNHGFGKLFIPRQPFLVIPVATTEEELEHLKEEVRATVAIYGDKVKVDGFAMPARQPA